MSARYYSEESGTCSQIQQVYREDERGDRSVYARVWGDGEVTLFQRRIAAREVADFIEALTYCIGRLPPEVQR